LISLRPMGLGLTVPLQCIQWLASLISLRPMGLGLTVPLQWGCHLWRMCMPWMCWMARDICRVGVAVSSAL